MAAFSTSHHLTALTFLSLFLKILAFDPYSSFSFVEFEKDPKFKSSVALYGNAKVVSGGSAVQLSGLGSSAAGQVMYKKPIKLFEGKPRQLMSFSISFAFSISLHTGDGLAFVMVPSGFEGDVFDNRSSGISSRLRNRKFMLVAVEISTSRGGRNGGSVNCHVAINVGNSTPAKIANTSSINMALSSGEKLQAWIDYEASFRRLEIRLSKHGHLRPSDPLIWQSIDFSHLWEEKKMFLGFSPVNGNNSQTYFLYQWSFLPRQFPHWMHSEPLDPKDLAKNTEDLTAKPRSDCVLKVLGAMIFGAGCGALAAFIVLYLWTIFGNRRPVVPEEFVVQPVDFEYKKVDIVVDKKAIKDGKK